MSLERKSPPMIINTPEDGFLRVGLTTGATSRADQVQLAGGCGASLRIFDDGGWELRSVNKPGTGNKRINGWFKLSSLCPFLQPRFGVPCI